MARPLLIAVWLVTAAPAFAADCGIYEYKAKIVRVYDGDTVWADIDLGFNMVLRNEPLRLHRVDTPEVTGADKVRGKQVRDLVAELIMGREVRICTVKRKDGNEKKGTFHRYLAEIWADDLNVNDWLLANGHAESVDSK